MQRKLYWTTCDRFVIGNQNVRHVASINKASWQLARDDECFVAAMSEVYVNHSHSGSAIIVRRSAWMRVGAAPAADADIPR